jgi:hypothetical protein
MTAALKISDELHSLVAAQRAARPEFDQAPQTITNCELRIRNRDRAASWRNDVYRAAAEAKRQQYGTQAEEINTALAEALAEGPDFARCRRGSDFRSPPKVNTDRNFIARLMFLARMIERKSYAVRAKGKHGGTLGKSALRLLEILLYVVNKGGGYLTPSYDALARLTCMSRRAIVTAMGVLETMGFVTIHRRIKRVQTPLGPKVVQDTNAYEYHLPKTGLGAFARAIFAPPSECTKFQAKESVDTKKGVAEKKVQERDQEDRWWLPEPWPTGAGGWR